MLKYIVAIVITLGVVWAINMDLLFTVNKQITPAHSLTALQKTINKCTAIADNSVAHLQTVVEFQHLEKIGRKARVMRLCMHDHQYQQYKRWTQYAKIEARKQAQQNHISIDEAFENLRRDHMVLLDPPKGVPNYWVPK